MVRKKKTVSEGEQVLADRAEWCSGVRMIMELVGPSARDLPRSRYRTRFWS